MLTVVDARQVRGPATKHLSQDPESSIEFHADFPQLRHAITFL